MALVNIFSPAVYVCCIDTKVIVIELIAIEFIDNEPKYL